MRSCLRRLFLGGALTALLATALPVGAGVLDELGDNPAANDLGAGVAAHARGDHKGAIERYTSALDTGSLSKANRAVVYNNRGNAYADLGEIESALADYDSAIRLDAAFAEAYFNRAHVLHRLGRFDAALQDYDRAIQLAPTSASAYFNRSFAWAAKGQMAKAVADVEKAIALNPSNAKYREQLADWKAAQGKPGR
jgi:tetratricopeptide (TPR) repeat protein